MSSRTCFDTSYLVRFWQKKWRAASQPVQPHDVVSWAAEIEEAYRTNAIVTPVYLEFLCGARDAAEARLYEHFLAFFELLDGGQVRDEDWELARQFGRRVPRNGAPRQAVDCLIRAIARRLRCEVLTFDAGFPR